jgi:hypothetical protein
MEHLGNGLSLAADGPHGDLRGAPIHAEISDLAIEDVADSGLIVACDSGGPASCVDLSLARASFTGVGFALVVQGASPIRASDVSASRILGVTGEPAAGVCVSGGGALALERFRLSGSAVAGARIDPGSGLDLSNGLVADQPIGIEVPPGYDLARLTRGVRYEGNGRIFAGAP